jgi:hypothetical protein
VPPLALHAIESADLVGGAGNNIFDVSNWTGGGSLNGGIGGSDRVIVTRTANFGLSDTRVSDSAGLSMALFGVPTAFLTSGQAPAAFNVASWSGTAFLHGAGVGPNSYAVTFKGSGAGTVNVADSGASGASTLVVNGTPGGDAITVAAGRIIRGNETVNFSGVAGASVRGNGPATVTVDTAPGIRTGFFVDGGPSGANTLNVVDTAGGAVMQGSLATGLVQVRYPDGSLETIGFQNVQQLQLNPDTSHSFVQLVTEAVTGQPASQAQLDQGAGLVSASGGRLKLVKSLVLSPAGREHLVNSWFQQYAGRPATGFELQRYGNLLRRQAEEPVLAQVILSIFRGPAGGNPLLFLELAGQALFGRPLTGGELAGFRRALRSGGRTAAVQAMLKTRAYRTFFAQTLLQQLLHLPAGQPLSPALQGLVNQLAHSKKDERSIRIFLEASDPVFNQA